jgi:hydrogenase/urease accessory protein HupE
MKGRSIDSMAEQFGRGRAKALPWYALLLLIQQIGVLLFPDRLHEVLWAVVSAVCILALFHGGGWVFPHKARRLADDESTKAHRSDALRLGFVAVMTGSLLLYALAFSEPLSGRDAVRLIVSIGLTTAMLRLGYLERRAYRNG